MDNCPPSDAFLQRSELLALKWGEEIRIWLQQKYFGTSDLTLAFKGLPITPVIPLIILTVLNVVQKMQLSGEDGAGYFLLWFKIPLLLIHFQFCPGCEKELLGVPLVQVSLSPALLRLWARPRTGVIEGRVREEVMTGVLKVFIYWKFSLELIDLFFLRYLSFYVMHRCRYFWDDNPKT